MTTFVETLASTPLWERWNVRFVSTHRPGSVAVRIRAYLSGVAIFLHALSRRPPTVVHLHMAKNGSFFRKATLLWIAKLRSVPVVLHMHGGEFGLFYDRMPAPVQWYVRTTLRAADRVLALGDRWADRLRELCPGARVVSVPNPIAIPSIDGLGERRPASEPVRVVFLGKMGPAKGTYVLLESWRTVIGSGPHAPCVLTLAGNGEVEQTRASAREPGLQESVEVRSWLGPDEVAMLLDSAHILVLPSRNEGQPMAILEAMSRALCVVATDVGGIPDLVENEVSGILVPPDDPVALAEALRRVIDDAALRHRLGDAGRERALRLFDSEVVWRHIERIYRDVQRSSDRPEGRSRSAAFE